MALEIVVRPELLAYENTVVIDDKILVLDLQYVNQLDRWMMSIFDELGAPIRTGIKLTTGVPLTLGLIDARMPQDGYFMTVRIGGEEGPARAGELGREVRLLWITQADIDEELAEDPILDLSTPLKIRSVA